MGRRIVEERVPAAYQGSAVHVISYIYLSHSLSISLSQSLYISVYISYLLNTFAVDVVDDDASAYDVDAHFVDASAADDATDDRDVGAARVATTSCAVSFCICGC